MLQACYEPATVPPVGRGRARTVPFNEAAASTQQQRTAALAKERVVEELIGAAEKRARTDGDQDLATIIKRMKFSKWNDG